MPTDRSSGALGRQNWRSITQTGFFLLFVLAPALNLLRFDLYETQLWFLGMRWSLGIDALARAEISAADAAMQLLWRAFVPGSVVMSTGFNLPFFLTRAEFLNFWTRTPA